MFPADALAMCVAAATASLLFGRHPHFVHERRQLARINKWAFRVLSTLLASLYVIAAVNGHIVAKFALAQLALLT